MLYSFEGVKFVSHFVGDLFFPERIILFHSVDVFWFSVANIFCSFLFKFVFSRTKMMFCFTWIIFVLPHLPV
jgi:hypothetical protein